MAGKAYGFSQRLRSDKIFVSAQTPVVSIFIV